MAEFSREAKALNMMFLEQTNVSVTRSLLHGFEEESKVLQRKLVILTSLNRGLKETNQAYFTGARALSNIGAMGKSWGNTAMRLRNVTLNMAEAQEAYNEAVEKFGKDSEEAQRAQRRLAEAKAGFQHGAFNLAMEALEAPRALGKIRKGLTAAGGRSALAGTAAVGIGAGIGLGIGGFFGKQAFILGARMAGASQEEAERRFQEKLENDESFRSINEFTTFGGLLPQLQAGGVVKQGGIAKVDPLETIIPAGKMAGGSRPMNVSITVNEARSPEETARRVVEELERNIGMM